MALSFTWRFHASDFSEGLSTLGYVNAPAARSASAGS
jgi:hypothetical protein